MELGHGAWQVTRQVQGPTAVKLELVFFEESTCRLSVASNDSRKGARALSQFATEAGAIAGCNGGYFRAGGNFGPVGIEIAGGKRARALEPPYPLGGALMVRQGEAALVWDAEFKDDPALTDYVHCNPWLVSEGRIWKPQEPNRKDVRAARTFIATDQQGRWLLGTASPVGLMELAQLLVTQGVITEFPVVRALNLDGGPSSAFWWRDTQGGTHEQKAGWAVRNVVLVLPRTKG